MSFVTPEQQCQNIVGREKYKQKREMHKGKSSTIRLRTSAHATSETAKSRVPLMYEHGTSSNNGVDLS